MKPLLLIGICLTLGGCGGGWNLGLNGGNIVDENAKQMTYHFDSEQTSPTTPPVEAKAAKPARKKVARKAKPAAAPQEQSEPETPPAE